MVLRFTIRRVCDGEGSEKKSKSPGLARNILALVEIVFDEPTIVAKAAEDAETAAAAQQAKKPKKAMSRKARQGSGPVGGFGAAEAEMNRDSDADIDLNDLDSADAYSASSPEIVAYVRRRYGNYASTVLNILSMWEAYGRTYAAWRDKWTSDTDPYRAMRALRLARAARDYQKWLIMVSNYKHKSWYVHIMVWITWRQIFLFGNTYVMSTVMIESRGARIKRIGRRLTSWWPLSLGFTAYKYIDRKTGELREGSRRYNSSPMHQILQKLVLQEESWHSHRAYNRPEKVRLQLALRTTLLKVEVDEIEPPASFSLLPVLLGKTRRTEE